MPGIKLGTFIPIRPDGHLLIGDLSAAVGCLRNNIHEPLWERLRAAPDVELFEELNFHNALIRSGEVWVDEVCLNELDAFAWYCEVDRRPGSFDLELLKTLSRSTKVIRDPHRFELALDKYSAHVALRDAGVRVPEFVLFDHRVPKMMEALLADWGAALLKPRRGGWGKGVTLIESVSKLRDIVGYIRDTAGGSPDGGFFLERYYDNDLDRWASLTMIGGEVIYGYRKKSERLYDMGGGKKKVLDAAEKGGGVELAKLYPEQIVQANKACEALGLGLIGFDMIWTGDGPMIIDENTSPGNYPELYAEVGRDPAELFANWILDEARSVVTPV